jgi:hypothetical protein
MRLLLVSQTLHRLLGRTDEFDVATPANLGEMGVLGKKTIARMNRLHVANFGGADDPIDLQVAFAGLGRSHAIGLVR